MTIFAVDRHGYRLLLSLHFGVSEIVVDVLVVVVVMVVAAVVVAGELVVVIAVAVDAVANVVAPVGLFHLNPETYSTWPSCTSFSPSSR